MCQSQDNQNRVSSVRQVAECPRAPLCARQRPSQRPQTSGQTCGVTRKFPVIAKRESHSPVKDKIPRCSKLDIKHVAAGTEGLNKQMCGGAKEKMSCGMWVLRSREGDLTEVARARLGSWGVAEVGFQPIETPDIGEIGGFVDEVLKPGCGHARTYYLSRPPTFIHMAQVEQVETVTGIDDVHIQRVRRIQRPDEESRLGRTSWSTPRGGVSVEGASELGVLEKTSEMEGVRQSHTFHPEWKNSGLPKRGKATLQSNGAVFASSKSAHPTAQGSWPKKNSGAIEPVHKKASTYARTRTAHAGSMFHSCGVGRGEKKVESKRVFSVAAPGSPDATMATLTTGDGAPQYVCHEVDRFTLTHMHTTLQGLLQATFRDRTRISTSAIFSKDSAGDQACSDICCGPGRDHLISYQVPHVQTMTTSYPPSQISRH